MKLAVRAILLALFAFLLIVLIGPAVVHRASLGGAGSVPPPAGEITPAAGEAIFWGKGRCATCHSVASRGGERRCPDLGGSSEVPPIGARAATRAHDVGQTQQRALDATDYLVESLVSPSAYVVTGYKPEMPAVMKPPLSLTPVEVRALVTYLHSLGGDGDPIAIRIPAQALAAAGEKPEWTPYLAGDAARGETIFFDAAGVACATCHRVGERGGQVGPDLTHVGGVRTAREIVEAILEPSASIGSGYDTADVEVRDRGVVTGVVTAESDTDITLALATGQTETISKAGVVARRVRPESVMPANFAELLSVDQLHDLLAYLVAQR